MNMRVSAKDIAKAERVRLDRMLTEAALPEDCGPEIPVAPARGPMVLSSPVELVLKPSVERAAGDDDYTLRPSAWLGRKVARRADVFDRMAAQSRKSRVAVDHDATLTPGRVMMARYYRDLTERHLAGGMRCSSLEAQAGRGSGGGSGEWIDTYVQEGRVLASLHRRIGSGSALAVRRVRPSARGTKSGILDRRLVDLVCLEDMDLSAVLSVCGWAPKGELRIALRRALCAALDRMQGYA